MKWLRYSHEGEESYGLLEGSKIYSVDGSPFMGYQKNGRILEVGEVQLEVPVVPRTFYCVGLNYAAHLPVGMKLPPKPDIGYRANNALLAHDKPILMPRDARKLHYEGELVVVIGKEGKHIPEAEALSYVLGYTIGNDVSERHWQQEDRTFWRSKNADTFKPMGPYICTDVDLDNMVTTITLNGELQIEFPTARMHFSIAKFISTMSEYLTLYPGDVIWMGTDGESPDLKSGDVVEISITGLGTLRNSVLQLPV